MTRGRSATNPSQIPAAGWKDIALRVKEQIAKDHVGLIAAGIAFYALLALFPAITAVIAIAGLVLDPADIAAQIEAIGAVLPEDAAGIVVDQATAVAGSQSTGLGIAAALGVLLALYSTSKGVASLMEGLNVAYDETETRGFVRLMAVKLVLTVFIVLGVLLALAASLVVPAVLGVVDLGPVTTFLIGLAPWAILAIATVIGISVLYRFGPSRADARWSWLTPGALVATCVWIASSIGFSIYAANFGNYNESFGSLAGVIVLLMWLWISAYTVLMGAELNAEMEAQTRADTTTGPARAMGDRGARKADHVAGAADG